MVKKVIATMMWACLFVSCNVDKKQLSVQKDMGKAELLMEDFPDSAYNIMCSIDTAIVNRSDILNMQYRLLLANAQNRAEKPMMSLEELQPAIKYYDENGSADEMMLANYLGGRICVLKNEGPLAMQYFQNVLTTAQETGESYNYRTLYRAHCQMAETYGLQKIFRKEKEELIAASDIAMRNNDTLSAIYAKVCVVRPLDMLGLYDDAIRLGEECAAYYCASGDRRMASLVRDLLLNAYMIKGEYNVAKEVIDDYERLSGFFDNNGHIEEGKEMFYYKKGLYYLKTGDFENAESLFRRLLDEQTSLNSREGAYSGLLQTYEKMGSVDSIGKYARLYCEAHDSVYTQMTTQDVIRMESVYGYERSKAYAETKTHEANVLLYMLYVIVALFFVSVFLLYLYLRQMKRNRKSEREKLTSTFEEEKRNWDSKFGKIESLKNEYFRTINILQEKLQKTTLSTDEIRERLSKIESEDGLQCILVNRLKPNNKKEKFISVEEREDLMRYAEVKYPHLNDKMIQSHLSDDDKVLVILSKLGFVDYSIRELLQLSPSAYTNRKSRINKKMFSDDNTKRLHQNISTVDSDAKLTLYDEELSQP